MDMVVGMLKGKAKLVLELIAAVVLTIFLAVMTYYAFGQLGKMLKISAMTATLHVPSMCSLHLFRSASAV